MATTIESLRKLGLKVNGTEPTNNNIGNVINEIADDYAGGSGSAGVSSIGGVDGAITLGEGLSMSGQELQVSASGGGTQLYQHTFSGIITIESEDMPITFNIISIASSAVTNATTANNMLNGFITGMAEIGGERITVVAVQPYADMDEDLYFYYALCTPAGDGLIAGLLYQKSFATVSDTVTAL